MQILDKSDGTTLLAHMSERLAEAEAQLKAKDKTLKVLVERARERQRNHESAYMALEQNVALQKVVKRKIDEVAERNRQLEAAHSALVHAQTELMQAQKLESIGRLASGVAHEINTPVQFVNDSLYFIRDAIQDLFALEAKSAEAFAASPQSAEIAALGEQLFRAAEEADLDYLREHLPKAVSRCMEGLRRVAEIVRSMRIFAHPDQKDASPVDINQSVTTTLTIATNEYKYVADVTTELGELPPVRCFAGEINQVLLNLIVNAAQAIADHQAAGERGHIIVRTRRAGDWAEIEIEDSGGGIPAEIHHCVFDPFFTTKEVGRGTGQGLAIAHTVVQQKHQGTITFRSTEGVGTTFLIRLPIGGPAEGEVKGAA